MGLIDGVSISHLAPCGACGLRLGTPGKAVTLQSRLFIALVFIALDLLDTISLM